LESFSTEVSFRETLSNERSRNAVPTRLR
jgi:hypothetical protein